MQIIRFSIIGFIMFTGCVLDTEQPITKAPPCVFSQELWDGTQYVTYHKACNDTTDFIGTAK